MRKTILVVTALLAALAAYAAPPADNVVSVPTPPTGACRERQTLVLAKSNGHVYGCVSGAWHDWTAAALAAVNVNSITGNLSVTGVVKAGGVDLNGDGTPELLRGSVPGGGGGPAPSVMLRGTSGSPALSFFPGHLDLDTPLRVPSLDLTADGTADLASDGSGAVVLHGVADLASQAADSARLGGYVPTYFAAAADLTAHVARVDNPHAVTAAQTGALPLTGGTVTGTTTYAQSGTGVGREVKTADADAAESRAVRITAAGSTPPYWDLVTVPTGELSLRFKGAQMAFLNGSGRLYVPYANVSSYLTLAPKSSPPAECSSSRPGSVYVDSSYLPNRLYVCVQIDATPTYGWRYVTLN